MGSAPLPPDGSAIARETDMLARPRRRSSARVPGNPVRYFWYSSAKDQSEQLKGLLRRLKTGGIRDENVTILSPLAPDRACASQLDGVSTQSGQPSTRVTVTSISAFKGLESDVVVLTDVEKIDGPWWKSVLYVGMSRARSVLFVFVSRDCKAEYETRLREYIETG